MEQSKGFELLRKVGCRAMWQTDIHKYTSLTCMVNNKSVYMLQEFYNKSDGKVEGFEIYQPVSTTNNIDDTEKALNLPHPDKQIAELGKKVKDREKTGQQYANEANVLEDRLNEAHDTIARRNKQIADLSSKLETLKRKCTHHWIIKHGIKGNVPFKDQTCEWCGKRTIIYLTR